ncbi:MAG: hypothetical protein JSR47_18420 [Proteobacteria bacterium]|nr:hypothetical protein [Pseudomonadota bacterium]
MIRELDSEQHVRLGGTVAILIVTIAWNLDWRHYVRYWVRPPSWTPQPDRRSERLRILLRGFFAISLVFALSGLIQLIWDTRPNLASLAYSLIDALIMLSLLAAIDIVVRWKLGPPAR